jgi:hypothetical protein
VSLRVFLGWLGRRFFPAARLPDNTTQPRHLERIGPRCFAD